MKRSTKIIATLLTLCLLIGIAVTSAFAAEADVSVLVAEQLKPSGATAFTGLTYGSGSNSAGNSTVDTAAVDARGNAYVRYYASGSTQINTLGSFGSFKVGNSSSKAVGTFGHVKGGVAQYDYAVIDLDFGTDRYKVQVGYKLNTTTTTTTETADDVTVKTVKYDYAIVPSYALYTPEELTEERVKADIAATMEALEILQRDEDHGCEVTTSIVTTTPKGGTATTVDNIAPMKTLDGYDLDDLSKYEMTYDEAMATKDLALCSGEQVYVMARYWKTADTAQTAYSNYSIGVHYEKDSDGGWSFIKDGEKVADMSDEPGQYDHITFVIKYNAPTGDATVGTVTGYVFVNGVLTKEQAATGTAYSFGLEEARLTVTGAKKTQGGHSFAYANAAVNYYSTGYTSGDAYGIDDYITSGDYLTKSLDECTDIVYTKNYISPNGYVRVNTALTKGTPVSHPELVEAELAKIKNGNTLYTTMDIADLDVPEGVEEFNIECGADVKITLSAAAKANRFALVKNGTGYTVSQDNSDITVYLKWLDIKGNHITTTPILYGEAPDASGIVANYVDESTNTIYYANLSGWDWDLDGEVGVVTSDMAEAGSTVTMTPIVDGEISSVSGATFYMGVRYDDTLVCAPVPASDGSFDKYVDGAALTALQEAVAGKYGDTLVLLTDFTGESGAMAPLAYSAGTQAIPAGKSISVDLNGHVFVREGVKNTFGDALFTLNEGASLNMYSSKAGGKLVMGVIRASAANLICQSAGIVNTPSKTDEATLSLGDMIGKNGKVISKCGNNFTYIGANAIVVSGTYDADGANGTTKYDAFATLRNDKKITVNLNGGYYYCPFRSSYALVCIQAPDVVINADGIELVCAYQTSSGLFHDYDSYTKDDKDDVDGNGVTSKKYYYATNTVATVKNSSFYSLITAQDGSGNYVSGTSTATVINRLDEESTAYFENCIVFGKLASKLSGNIVLGAGNTIVDTAGIKFDANSKITYADGVSYVVPSNYPYSKTIAAAKVTGKWAEDMDLTISDQSKITGVVDTATEGAYISSASFKPQVWTETVDMTFTGNVSVVTYDGNYVPDIFTTVNWCTAEGELIDTTLELIGTEPTPPESVTSVVGSTYTYKWYTKGFTWSDASGLIVKEGTNVFKPTPFFNAAIRGIKANVSLFEDVVYNLYLPVSDLVSDITVTGATLGADTVTISGESYYVVSATLPINEFDPTTCTVSFKAEGSPVSQTLTLDLLAYATVVADRYTCGSEEATLVYEMLSYKAAAAKVADTAFTASEKLTAFLDAHTDCACTATAIEPSAAELAVDYSAIKAKGVSSIAYVLTLGDVGMAIYTDGAIVDSVAYTDDFGREVVHTAANGDLILRDGYYLVKGISAAHINNVISITVDGAEGTYSLAKYIENNPDVEVAKNIYKYAVASEDYKYIRESENDKATYKKMQSVLLIGQSNMTSSNNLYEAIQIEDDRLFMMRDYGWVKMQEPIHTGSPLYGAGIGATFGKAFVETFDVDLGLIPAAKGGTTLNDWRVGGDLYNNAMAMAKAAQETSEICAILWHQGEGDQNNQNYAALLQVIFDGMIEELGLDPDKIVIITGELFGTRSDAVHMPQLIELGKHYKNYGIALSDGLTVRDEKTHFDAPSMRVFGYRYFDLFYNLTTGKHYYFNQDPNFYKAIDEE